MYLLEEQAGNLKPGFALIQAHFVLGDYYRRFDEPLKAEEQFSLARSVQWVDEDGAPTTGSEYIESLIVERLALMQGN